MKKIFVAMVVSLILGFPGISWTEDGSADVEVGVETEQQQSNINSPSITFEGGEPFRQFPNPPGFIPAYPPSGFVPPRNPYTDIKTVDGPQYSWQGGNTKVETQIGTPPPPLD